MPSAAFVAPRLSGSVAVPSESLHVAEFAVPVSDRLAPERLVQAVRALVGDNVWALQSL
jgi:hypothetical protein